MASPVYEESRCPINSAANAADKVVSYTRFEFPGIERPAQSRCRQSQLLNKPQEQLAAQAFLVFKQKIMHLPEFPMGGRKLSGLCGGLSMRMRFSQGEVPKSKPEALIKMLLKALDYGVRPSAVGAFVIAVLYQGYFRSLRTLGVVFRCNWHFENDHKSFPISATPRALAGCLLRRDSRQAASSSST